ncbi:hypothetical protein AB1Y20_007242 [Prymnesium parvum]|uniref:Fibronectin type-II domain-containing protein n=1 Tax=Prymnesium parvum TaxID=97485 RepID=A0AB34IX29_PRYPA
MVPSLPSIAFKALDGKIYAHNELRGAEPFALKGVNWFGAEGEGKCPDGLWQRPAADYLDSIVSLGFNSIRLPLAVDNVLDDPFVNKWSLTANEELQGLRSLAVLERLITMAGARGLLVLLDMHRLSAKIWPTTHGLWFSPQMSSQRLHDAWERLARRFCSHWNVFAADLFNEPWGANLALATGRSINTSESTSRKHANREGDRQGIRATDHAWSVAASSIGATVNSICPRWLIFVEGVGSASDEELCELCFWGENLLGLRWASRNMPLVQLPVPDQLVFSPHVYGPGTNSKMFYFNRSAFPQYPDNMIAIWRQHFLEPARLAGATLVVGEWGGNYLGDDELWQDKFKSFLLEEHLSSFYWALNPNSGDTGGLLLDDWQTVHTAKAHLLAELPSSSVNLTLAGLPAFPCPTPAEQSTSASSDRFYKCGEGNTLSTPGVSSGEGWCVHAAQTCNGIAECKDSSDERQDLCHSLRRKQPCITTSGQDPLRPCVFPFRYRGEEFTSCSMDDAINGLAWCPTQVDDIGEFFEFSKWGACGPGCPREEGMDAATVSKEATKGQAQQLVYLRNASTSLESGGKVSVGLRVRDVHALATRVRWRTKRHVARRPASRLHVKPGGKRESQMLTLLDVAQAMADDDEGVFLAPTRVFDDMGAEGVITVVSDASKAASDDGFGGYAFHPAAPCYVVPVAASCADGDELGCAEEERHAHLM